MKEYTKHLKEILDYFDSNSFIRVLLIALLSLSSGVLALFFFERELFQTLDILRLILLALSLVVPFVIVNLFLVTPFFQHKEQAGIQFVFVAALGVTNIEFFTVTLISFFTPYTLNQYLTKVFLLTITIFLITLFILLLRWRFRK